MVATAKRPTEAWHGATLYETGLGQVIVARFKASGEAEVGVFLDPDYKKGARVFGGIDPGQCTRSFVFGVNGKPSYVPGPNDSPAFAAHVLNTISRRLGTTGADAAALADALPGTDEAGGQSDTSAAGAKS